MALDIKDVSGLIRRLLQAAGLDSVITALYNWSASLVGAIPTLSLWLFGLGMFALLMLAIPRLRWPRRRSPGASKGQGAEQPAVDLSEWVTHIDRLFTFQINRFKLRHLWNDAGLKPNSEPTLLFELVVYNNSPMGVLITGVEGQASIDGDPCHDDASIEGVQEIRIAPWGHVLLEVKQRLSMARGQEILGTIGKGERINVSTGSMKFSMRVEDDRIDLPPRPIAVAFEVDSIGITVEKSEVTKRAVVVVMGP